MKNIKIFPKDWLQLHPYKQSNPVDSYYTGIANRIYNIMEQTELINSFEGDEAKQIAIRIAAYFEDVISELGIWRAFLLKNKELYGKYDYLKDLGVQVFYFPYGTGVSSTNLKKTIHDTYEANLKSQRQAKPESVKGFSEKL